MKDESKTKARLIEELTQLRRRVNEFESREAERRQVETALRSAEERYRTLVEESFDGIFVQKGRLITFANNRLHEMLGFPDGELIGLDHWRVYHPEYQELTRTRAQARLRGEEAPARYEVRLLKKDGSSFECEIRARAIVLEGEPGIQVWVRDITASKRAEAEIRAERERFRALIDQSPLGVSRIRPDGRYAYVNPAFTEIFGYTLTDVPDGRTWYRLAYPDPDERRAEIADWKREIEGRDEGPVMTKTSTVRCKDGSAKVVHFRVVNLTGSDHLVLFEDITERTRAREALKFEREQLVSIFDSIDEVIYVSDTDTYEILYVNQALRDAFQKDPVGGLCYREFQDLEAPCDFCTNPIILKRKYEPYRWEYHNPIVDRDYVVVDRIIRWPDGRDVRFEMAIDDTERRRAEETLRQNEERLRAILEASPDPVVVYDREGTTSFVNPAFTRTFGWTLDELKGEQIPFVPDEEQEATLNAIKQLFEHGRSVGLETRRLNKEGEVLDIVISAAGIRDDPSGEVTGMVVNLTDVTDRKRLEAQFRQAQKMEAIGTLAGGIAHDFNNILAAVMGYAELALDNARAGRPSPRELERVLEAAERAKSLVRQILTFSRKVEALSKPMSLNRVVIHAAGMLERTIPKMIEIELGLSAELRAIQGDATQLEQVLMNLGTNAVDAMPDGGQLLIETEDVFLGDEYCRGHMEVKPGQYVWLRVSDTGLGMDQETLSLIYDPFFTTKDVGRGTGLGLATVFGIVKDHGGHITCYSEVGSGTVFNIYLPALEATVSDIDAATGAPEETQGGVETILVVDDERPILEVAADFLKRYGYTVLVASSGEEALEVYREQGDGIDLIILDLGMPGMGGHKALGMLREFDPEVKVIIASGYSANGQVKDSLEGGAAGFIGKPYRFHDMLQTVRQVLDS